MMVNVMRLVWVVALLLAVNAVVFAQDETTTFTVTIENVSSPELATTVGVFNTPVGAMEPGPALPGAAYEFSFTAEPGDYLSFATMYVQSNDLFLAPEDTGIALFDDMGSPISGSISDQVLLWDAGVEVNEEPGVGENQAPRQAGPDTGVDENGVVRLVDDGYSYQGVSDIADIQIDAMDNNFTVTITNISGDTDLPTPFSPGVFVIHSEGTPLFANGQPDFGMGLEALAEDGNAAPLADLLSGLRIATPLSPGVYAVHSPEIALFAAGEPDLGLGMEALAEDGNAAPLAESLSGLEGISASGIFNTPVGQEEPGPALPGSAYQFSFEAQPGDYLSFATMFVQSNDLFFAPDPSGIALFDDMGSPISGTITELAPLWDAGTEADEPFGEGANQAPRQEGPNTGDDEMEVVTNITAAGFEFEVPPVANTIRVTITTE